MGSLSRTQWSSRSFGFACLHSGAPSVHSESPGFTCARLVVVGLITVRVVSLWLEPRCLRFNSFFIGFTPAQ